MNCTLYFILPHHKIYFFKNLTLQFRSHTGNWQYFVINSQQVKTPSTLEFARITVQYNVSS